MTRRDLLAGAVGLALTPAAARAAEPTYPYATLDAALAAAGFDPKRSGAFTCAWASDPHFGQGDPASVLGPVLDEVNRISPRPAFFAITGDLINKASTSFGNVPDEGQKRAAIEEFKLVKAAVAGLDPAIPLKLGLGNHDTYPGEDDPALFHAVFPEHPEYHAFTVKDVRFVVLNGGSSGFFDAAQRAWFRDEVRARHKPGATLITVTHQPSLGSISAERGVPAAYREALGESTGDLWLIGGHAHTNADECFRLPRAVLTQATITTANGAVWGTEKPGWWLYCFDNGRLAARLYRRIGQGWRIAPPPEKEHARPLRLPFEDRKPLWKVMVGEDDVRYRVSTKAAWCLNYWHYNRELVYRFPLESVAPKANRFVLVGGAPTGKPEAVRYATSPDGAAWTEATGTRAGGYVTLAIPEDCRAAGTLYARMEGCVVAGFGLEES